LIFENKFEDFDAKEIVALLSCFIFQEGKKRNVITKEKSNGGQNNKGKNDKVRTYQRAEDQAEEDHDDSDDSDDSSDDNDELKTPKLIKVFIRSFVRIMYIFVITIANYVRYNFPIRDGKL
jgi:superfamily II RNA helicase